MNRSKENVDTFCPDACAHDALVNLPGGIRVREFEVAGRTIRLAVPSEPDAILESATVSADVRGDAYWSVVWPVSIRMATLMAQRTWGARDRFLELGCGTGLVGVSLAALGHQLEMTDVSLQAVALAAHSCGLNDVRNVTCYQLDWTDPQASAENVSVIVAADVLYTVETARAVLHFLRSHLAVEATAWIADPGRQTTEQVLGEMDSADSISVAIFDEQQHERRALQIGQFNLLRFTRCG